MDPQHSNQLYVALSSGVFPSADSGASWTLGALPSSVTQIQSLLVDSAVSSRIWASSDHGLLVSTDSGATWGSVMSTPFLHVTAMGANAAGTIYVASDQPFAANAVTHVDQVTSAASPSIQAAPGEIVSVYGGALASGTASSTTIPLPIALSDASVMIQTSNGRLQSAPFFYVSPTQINLQIPVDTPVGRMRWPWPAPRAF